MCYIRAVASQRTGKVSMSCLRLRPLYLLGGRRPRGTQAPAASQSPRHTADTFPAGMRRPAAAALAAAPAPAPKVAVSLPSMVLWRQAWHCICPRSHEAELSEGFILCARLRGWARTPVRSSRRSAAVAAALLAGAAAGRAGAPGAAFPAPPPEATARLPTAVAVCAGLRMPAAPPGCEALAAPLLLLLLLLLPRPRKPRMAVARGLV